MTVIADEAQVHDIGGIMGGEDSGVTDATTDVHAGSRLFHARADRAHRPGAGLTSDARSRFERGVDPAFLDDGLAILTGPDCGHLRRRAIGGRPSRPAAGRDARAITFDYERTKALGGIDVPEQRQRAILDGLGFALDGPAVDRPELAARRRGTRRSGRGNRPHRGYDQCRRPRSSAKRAWPGRPRRGLS